MNSPKWRICLLLSCFNLKNDACVAFRWYSGNKSWYDRLQGFEMSPFAIASNRCRSRERAIYSLHSTRIRESETSISSMVESKWATHAFFISSFSEGFRKSSEAKNILKNNILSNLRSEWLHKKEEYVRQSALYSPCCGPDIELLNDLEEFDVQTSDTDTKGFTEMLKKLAKERQVTPMDIRLVYIPTAMYALRPESKNTPGKQRQRARADGKKRRSTVIKQLELLFEQFNVLAVSLDLDDASLKQPYGSDDASLFPVKGEDALGKWAPHIIYVEGGNTFWLQHCLEKGDWGPLLVSACTGKDGAVYFGNSAGAIIAGKLVETASWKGRDNPGVVESREHYKDWAGVSGLRMAGNISIFPHMSDEWFPIVESKKATKEFVNVVTLRDDQILFVDGQSESTTLIEADDQ